MREVADLIALAFRDLEKNRAEILGRVDALIQKHPIYCDCHSARPPRGAGERCPAA